MAARNARAQHLRVHDVERGDVLVPLHHRGDVAGAAHDLGVEPPHGVDRRPRVRVDAVRALVGVSSEMHLDHAVVGQRGEVRVRIPAVVAARDVDVVHVEQERAVGLLRETREELGLAHARAREGDVARGVLENERTLEEVLHHAHALDHVGQHGLVVRQRQEIVVVAAGHAGPAHVVAEPHGPRARRQARELAQVGEVDRVGAADRERHAVHHDRIALGDAVEHLQRAPAGVHEVLGDDLEPVHRGLVLEHVSEVLRAQPQAEPEVGEAEAIGGRAHHGSATAVPTGTTVTRVTCEGTSS